MVLIYREWLTKKQQQTNKQTKKKGLNLQTDDVAPLFDFKKLKLVKRWTREAKIMQKHEWKVKWSGFLWKLLFGMTWETVDNRN